MNNAKSLRGILRSVLLQNFIRAGTRIIDEIKISVTAKGIFVQAMDESKICLISFSIPAEYFKEYQFAGMAFEFALNVEKSDGIVHTIPTPARKKPTKKMIKEGKEYPAPRNYFVQFNADIDIKKEIEALAIQINENLKKTIEISKHFSKEERLQHSKELSLLKPLLSYPPEAFVEGVEKARIALEKMMSEINADATAESIPIETEASKEFNKLKKEFGVLTSNIGKIEGDILNIFQTDVATLKMPATLDWDEEKVPPTAELDVQFDKQGDISTQLIRNGIMLAEEISDTLELKIEGHNLLLASEVEGDIFEYSIPLQFEGEKVSRGIFSLSFLKNLFGAKKIDGALSDTPNIRIFVAENAPLKITAKIGSPEEPEKIDFSAYLAPRVEAEESYEEEELPIKTSKRSPTSKQVIKLERRSDLNLPPLEEYAGLEEITQLFESPEGLVILSQFKRPENPNLLKRWDQYFSDFDILLIKGDQCEAFTKEFFEHVIKLIAQKAGGDSSTFSKNRKLLMQFLKRDPSLNRILSLIDKTEWFIPLTLDGISLIADFLAESKERETDIELIFPKARWKHELKHEKLRISVNEFNLLFPTFIACANQIRGITEKGKLALEKLKELQSKAKRNLIWNSSNEHIFELVVPMDDPAISALEKAHKIIKLNAILADNSFDFHELLEKIKPEFEVPVPQLRPILEQWRNQTLSQTSRDDLAVIIRNIEKLVETCQSIGTSLLFGNLIVDYLQELKQKATFVENIPPEQQTFDPSALVDDFNSFASGNDMMDLLLERLDNVVFWSQMGSKIRDRDLILIKKVIASIETFIEKNEKSKMNLETLIEITRNLHLEQEKLIPLLPRIVDELRIIFGKFRLAQPVELLPYGIEIATADVLLHESMNRLIKLSQKATIDLIRGQVRNLEAFQLDVNKFRAEIIEKINKSSKDPTKIRDMWDKVFSLIESFARNTSNLKQYDEINKWPYEHEQINLRSELQAIEKIFDSLADSINEFISPITTSSDSFSARILHSDFMSLSGMIRALEITQRKPIKYHQLDAWRKE